MLHSESPEGDARRRIAVRFFLLFEGLPAERLAQLLDVSGRHVKRLQGGRNVPRPETSARMGKLLDEVKSYGALSPAERNEMAERRRDQAERDQKLVRPLIIDGLEDNEIPPWYANVRNQLDQERWAHAMERIAERLADPGDWARVPERTRANVLADHALCHHKTGRFVAACDYAEQALAARRAQVPTAPSNSEREALDRFLAIVTTNLGCSRMQSGFFEDAYRLFATAVEHKRDYWPIYYNRVCAASLAKDETLIAVNLGGMKVAASAHLSPDDIDEMVQDAETDKDLVFARQTAIFATVLAEIREIAARRRPGRTLPINNPAGNNAASNNAEGSLS